MTEIFYTHRTRDGLKARIICNDRIGNGGNTSVVALVLSEIYNKESVYSYDASLSYYGGLRESPLDLFEYSFWQDVLVDTPILVKSYEQDAWLPRHFAKYEDNVVHFWLDGRTSHTTKVTVSAGFAKLKF
jgi:hypothetical protein